MSRQRLLVGMAMLLSVAGCAVESPAPSTTQVIVQPPPQATAAFITASPGPPPPPHDELVPPPPTGSGPVVWQPGHWAYTGVAGNPWSWRSGQYVAPPQGQATWVPGKWQQQPSGGWGWVEGHWA